MANLSGPMRTRGQILLVTALILGVSFVALALILNSAIFTENLASRGDTTGADEVVTYQNNLEEGIGNVVAFETRNATNGDDHATVLGRVETGISDADNVTVRRHARRGATSNVSIDDRSDGSRIYQTNESRNFTNAATEADWTVAEDVENTRAFRFNVNDYVGSTGFVVLLDDGTETWEMELQDSSGDVTVVVDNGTSGTESCTPASTPAEIDVTAGTVAGDECEALAFEDAPSGTYSIDFRNGAEFTGTYSIVVDNETVATSPLAPHFSASDDPTVAAAVYDVTVEYYYSTADIVVGKDLRIAPGETDG